MRVSFITSVDEQCGIAIYSHELADELRSHIRLDIVPYDTELPISSNLTHIQFQYPFFGGLAPHKTQFPAFLKKDISIYPNCHNSGDSALRTLVRELKSRKG